MPTFAYEQDTLSELNMSKVTENTTRGWLNGFIGVVLFSGSLPATRVAVLEFNPVFVTLARASIAGILAGIALLIFKEKRPDQKQIFPLAIVALGVVVG